MQNQSMEYTVLSSSAICLTCFSDHLFPDYKLVLDLKKFFEKQLNQSWKAFLLAFLLAFPNSLDIFRILCQFAIQPVPILNRAIESFWIAAVFDTKLSCGTWQNTEIDRSIGGRHDMPTMKLFMQSEFRCKHLLIVFQRIKRKLLLGIRGRKEMKLSNSNRYLQIFFFDKVAE